MDKRLWRLALPLLIAILCGCDPLARFHGHLSKPEAASIDLSDQTLTKFDGELSQVLFRYLSGNPRWEIREERGKRFAIRLERVQGKFETTLNGFYSTDENDAVRQTRVLISFGDEYGVGVEHANVTRTQTGKSHVSVVIENDAAGTPGNSSYVIVAGGAISLEIYDQAPQLARQFTQLAFDEVSAELRDVIAHRKSVGRSGVIPVPKRYPAPLPKKSFFAVKDGMQPGIYLVSAAIRPAEPGYAFVKAFNVKSGERLSEERMTPRSIRYVGWSGDGATCFPYQSEVTVYEGDWSSTYEARFELWHRTKDGKETKLAEQVRTINGWQR